MIGKLKQHYEKVICACCFLLLFTNVGLASTSFSVYQPYLVELPGVGHSGGSIVISIRTFISVSWLAITKNSIAAKGLHMLHYALV